MSPIILASHDHSPRSVFEKVLTLVAYANAPTRFNPATPLNGTTSHLPPADAHQQLCITGITALSPNSVNIAALKGLIAGARFAGFVVKPIQMALIAVEKAQ